MSPSSSFSITIPRCKKYDSNNLKVEYDCSIQIMQATRYSIKVMPINGTMSPYWHVSSHDRAPTMQV